MKRKRRFFALAATAAVISLASYATGELRRVGVINAGESRVEAPVMEAAQDYTVPVTFAPTQEQYDQCVRIDNNPNVCWGPTGIYGTAFTIGFDYDNPLDNWLILPSVSMQTGDYKFTCEYITRACKENFEIYLLDAADPAESHRVHTLLDKDNYQNSDWRSGEATFSIATSGSYYIALHASSAANMHGIAIRNLSLVSNNSAQPKAPEISTYNVEGLQGKFSVKLPEKDISGKALQGQLSLIMKVDDVNAPTKTGNPGEVLDVDYTFTSGSHNVVFLVKSIADGLESEPASVDIIAHQPAPVPMQIPFTLTPNIDEFYWCEVLNMSSDDQTWKYTTSNTGNYPSIGYSKSDSYRADDWLILPEIAFPEPGLYELSFDVYTKNTAESLMVCFGDNNDIGTFYKNRLAEYEEFTTRYAWEKRTIKISVTTPGSYYIAFLCYSTQRRGDLCLKQISVKQGEGGVPLPPVISSIDMNGGDGTVTVKMPQKSYDGKDITGTLTAHLSIDGIDEDINVTGAPDTDVTLPVRGLDKGEHTATVSVSRVINGVTYYSDAVTEKFVVSSNLDLRYKLPFAINMGEDFHDFTLLDANSDGYTWVADGNAVKYSYSTVNAADDWLFSRPVQVTQDNIAHILEVAVEAYAGLSSTPESFEIWIGTQASPDGMTTKLIDAAAINNTQPQTFSSEFALEEPGDYIIGVHVVSPVSSGYLYLENLGMRATDRVSSTPGYVTDLYADADQTGALKATLTFNFPTRTASGVELDPATSITATAVCGEHKASTTGLPGSEGEITIDTAEGVNEITVTCSNADGEGLGTKTTVTCGLDRPLTPRILRTTVSEDNRSMTVQWRAVTSGENDGIVNAPAMRYMIYSYDEQTKEWSQIDDTKELTYTYSVPDGQDFLSTCYVGVRAYNAPESVSAQMASTNAVLGTPYELPINETFADKSLHYGPVSLFSSQISISAPQWYIGNPGELNASAVCPDNNALIGHTEYSSGDTQVEFPKFSTSLTASSPDVTVKGFTISFDIYLCEYTPSMNFLGYCYGKENAPVTIGTLDTSMAQGWTTVSFTLPEELNGKEWVAVRDVVDFSRGDYDWALLDSYKFEKIEQTGVDEVLGADNQSITAGRGVVTLRGYAGTQVQVYNVAGVCLGTREVVADQYAIALAPGIYVINAAGTSHKVIVK